VASEKPKGMKLLKAALSTRKSASMLAFGFSSGLPFALLIGTLNAWLGEVGINLATIGVLSWIGLTYSFKFLWSPAVDRLEIPGVARLGRRKSWILTCQVVLIGAFVALGLTDPVTNIGWFAIFAFLGSFASATQDVAVDAWRIDVADEKTPVELLSAIYQFGYRTASIIGGAFALFLAARMSWGAVYLLMAVFVLAVLFIALAAPDTERPPKGLIDEQLRQPGEWRRASPPRAGRRPGRLGLGDGFDRPVHGLDAGGSRKPAGSFRRSRTSPSTRAMDHRRDGVRAAVRCRDRDQLAEGTRGAGSRPPVDDNHSGGRGGEPHLRSAGLAARGAGRAPPVGRADHHRLHPHLRALLQYLVELRLPLLPRLSPLHEGRGRLRVQDLRHHHDHDRHQPGRLSVRSYRRFRPS
jgi:hypothetical protein